MGPTGWGMQMKVLITGGAGFIGSHTADLLLEKNISVTVFDNLSTGNLDNLNLNSDQLRFVQGDVLDYPALAQEVHAADAVLHLAALPSVPKSIEDPLQSHAVNTVGFLHVLQAIRMAQKPIRLVYASSSAIYGDTQILPCNDEIRGDDVLSPYALQKVQDEQYARLYEKLFKMPSLGLRYFNVYGTRQDPRSVYSGVISRFLDGSQQAKTITIFGDGKQSRDFIHVSDVARANVLALQSHYAGVLNIATGNPETLLDLVSYMEETRGKSLPVEFKPARVGDIRNSYADTKKAYECLQFKYETSLREGIKRLMRELAHV
jgi:UDP-glucose 4-epimerase